MLIAMFAWVFRFGFFGLGNPAFPGVTLFILSCIVYGVAFDFFNVSGGRTGDQPLLSLGEWIFDGRLADLLVYLRRLCTRGRCSLRRIV